MVRSQELKDGKPVASGSSRDLLGRAGRSAPWRAVGLVALVVGLVLWLIGARYTTLGGARGIGLLAGVFGLDIVVPLPTGWSLVGAAIAVGLVVSLTEFGARPRRSFFSTSLVAGLVLLLIWSLVITGDISSTYIGVTTPDAGAWTISYWLAANIWAAGAWSAFLTFVPELLIIGGIRWLVRGRF